MPARELKNQNCIDQSTGMVVLTAMDYSGTKACSTDTAIDGPGMVNVDWRTYEAHCATTIVYSVLFVNSITPVSCYSLFKFTIF